MPGVFAISVTRLRSSAMIRFDHGGGPISRDDLGDARVQDVGQVASCAGRSVP